MKNRYSSTCLTCLLASQAASNLIGVILSNLIRRKKSILIQSTFFVTLAVIGIVSVKRSSDNWLFIQAFMTISFSVCFFIYEAVSALSLYEELSEFSILLPFNCTVGVLCLLYYHKKRNLELCENRKSLLPETSNVENAENCNAIDITSGKKLTMKDENTEFDLRGGLKEDKNVVKLNTRSDSGSKVAKKLEHTELTDINQDKVQYKEVRGRDYQLPTNENHESINKNRDQFLGCKKTGFKENTKESKILLNEKTEARNPTQHRSVNLKINHSENPIKNYLSLEVTKSADDVYCVVCLLNTSSFAIVPCGHKCLCISCTIYFQDNKSNCPLCKELVKSVKEIFE